LLNGELFHSVLEGKVVIDERLVLYNTRRPHRGLGGKTPAAYAKMCRSHLDDDSFSGCLVDDAGGRSWTLARGWSSSRSKICDW
jgi:hypothetical protein